MGVEGRIHSTESFGTVDGPGIRYVVFTQGCGLRCLYCHNPDTWMVDKGKFIDSDKLMADILTYKNFIRSGGLTVSGGEPLLQPAFTLDLFRQCKEHNIHTALDTAGAVPLKISKPVIVEANLILLDIKALNDEICIKLTGKSNALTLKTLDYCEEIGKPVWIRHVLVPGYTLDMTELTNLAKFLQNYKCVQLVDLLPFHKMGEFKWEELGLKYELTYTPVPRQAEIYEANKIFEDHGLKTIQHD